MQKLEYLWLDGCTPTTIRSKTKVVKEFYHRNHEAPEWGFDPLWGFDGSSTQQANGDNSDCVLKPIKTYINPLEENSTIILCEVYNVDTSPHVSNTRKKLNKQEDKQDEDEDFDVEEDIEELNSKIDEEKQKMETAKNVLSGNFLRSEEEYDSDFQILR